MLRYNIVDLIYETTHVVHARSTPLQYLQLVSNVLYPCVLHMDTERSWSHFMNIHERFMNREYPMNQRASENQLSCDVADYHFW